MSDAEAALSDTRPAVSKPLRVVIVTNIPAPYRLPIYALLARRPDLDIHVVFCSGCEPDRAWNLGKMDFPHTFLKERFVARRGRYIHFNHDILAVLRSLKPEVVITTGFNPTHLFAYAWARLHGARHVAMTDGTLESERTLSCLHRWIRRRVFSHSDAYIGASDGAMRLFQSYGVPAGAMFKSHLCTDNGLFLDAALQAKRFDFIFCGRFVAAKNPTFALEVARDVALRLGRRVAIVFVGSGELEAKIRAFADGLADQVETTFAGFAQQEDLPEWYQSSRVLLFPTLWDPWGVVANEACAAGVPVLISPAAGSAGELIGDGENGYVLPLEKEAWVSAAVRLLSDEPLYATMAARGRERVAEYSFENAARGLAEAALAADRACPRWSSRRARARPKVAVIQRRMTHYRVPLFNLLRERLDQAGVELMVVYGDPTASEQLKADSGHLPWGRHVPCHYWFNGHVCWQNALPWVHCADLVVVTQENKLLFNHLLAVLHGKQKWAFWGHGRNFQARSRNMLKERLKRWLASHVDWWFAYTSLSKAAVLEAGFPVGRVTVLDNAIDTTELAAQLAALDAAAAERARHEFGIGPGRVCVTLGSLHADKRLGFLFEAARLIRAQVPDFRLVVVGDGPQRELVEGAVADAGGWIHWLGARSGRDKALLLAMSQLMLNPGMVGLSVLDSFVAGVPMVTTAYPSHSPEIAYLQSGQNGLMTDDNVAAFAAGVVGLLTDAPALAALRAGCQASAREYSLEQMADNFRDGILACLSTRDVEAT